MHVVEIVFGEDIKIEELSVDEILEIVRKTVKEFNDGNGIKIELRDWNEDCYFEFAVKSTTIERAKEELKRLMDIIWERIGLYTSIKPFLAIYSRNGKINKEIFEKNGITVIS